ncbi:hypothetical protein K9N68_39010 (plasmid) [Kovacikia minuta CCNUW1]|uniref:hypothetical protein n=1 Tax=Kovacikia minuta TaxID=2931930 RepID=UPI001CC9ED78|nr:hypothetical protein [Kovacikia minuta]UBF30136.1 hypothetical protein K9N68_39010 [Kovacikia minuta CCNUW1]
MIRILTTLASVHVRPQHCSGRAAALFAFEGMYRFSGGKAVSEGIDRKVTEWLNPEQLISSGRCRTTLTPT